MPTTKAAAAEGTQPHATDPVAVVTAYLEATAGGDLDAAARWVADDSVVYESGGEQGSWQQYREHHLGPELTAFERFDLERGKPRTWRSEDGSLALVVLPMAYEIGLRDGRTVSSLGTATFGLVRGAEGYRIVHVHWSSRPKPKEDGSGHGHGH